MPDGPKYVVRGAKMWCNCGSHHRRINLPASHGSYVNGNPMMNEADNKAYVNISHFGACKSATNPSNQVVYFVGEDGGTVSGKPCCPNILSTWMKTKVDTKVEGKAALTTESQLVCGFGGLIVFKSDGQEEA